MLGFCALGNIEWKTNRSFGIGLSGGVGITIEETPRITYLGGASLFIGGARQISLYAAFLAKLTILFHFPLL